MMRQRLSRTTNASNSKQ